LGRVSQWKLDETGTTTNTDDAWKINDATLTNFSFDTTDGWRTGSQCVSGGCLSFDGINDYALTASSGDFNIVDEITLGAWVYQVNATGVQRVIWNTGLWTTGYNLYLQNGTAGGQIIVEGASRIATKSGADINKWHYLTCTYSSSTRTLTIYLNGAGSSLTLTGLTSYTINGANSAISLSRTTSEWFNGLIDDARVYNQAISASQINQNYYIGINKLFKNNRIAIKEYNQRLSELRESLSNK